MAQRSIDEIRKLVDPAGYTADLEAVKKELESQRGRLFANLDLHHDDPEMNDKERERAVADVERLIRSTQWRIERIDERLEAMRDGALPSRAERRRKVRGK